MKADSASTPSFFGVSSMLLTSLASRGSACASNPVPPMGFRHGDGVGVFLLQKGVELFLFLDGQDGDASVTFCMAFSMSLASLMGLPSFLLNSGCPAELALRPYRRTRSGSPGCSRTSARSFGSPWCSR